MKKRARSINAMKPVVVRLACMILFLLPAISFFAGCEKQSGYSVRMVAIRATRELDPGVPLSLWLYTGTSTKELTKVFVSGRITGTGWIDLDDAETVGIPQKAISEDETFHVRAALNPNRMAAPTDAVFEATVSMPFLFVGGGEDSGQLFIKAADSAPFELELKFSAR